MKYSVCVYAFVLPLYMPTIYYLSKCFILLGVYWQSLGRIRRGRRHNTQARIIHWIHEVLHEYETTVIFSQRGSRSNRQAACIKCFLVIIIFIFCHSTVAISFIITIRLQYRAQFAHKRGRSINFKFSEVQQNFPKFSTVLISCTCKVVSIPAGRTIYW